MLRHATPRRTVTAVALAFIGLLPCLAGHRASAEPAVPPASVPELADDDDAQVPAPERKPFTASIPGTTVDIELLPVPDALLGRPLWVARTETTWDAYDAFVFELAEPASVPDGLDAVVRPSHPYILADYGFGHAGFPVISVSHAGAAAFCEWLSVLTGRRFRLPTEAEFDALCAAAAIDPEALGKHAWIAATSDDQTHAVGTLAPDALGLHDLLGNAAEWCTAADGSAVSKGGAYLDGPDRVTCAARRVPTPAWNMRDPQIPKSRWWLSDASFAGFRIVCDDAP